ncbi:MULTISPECIES: hypothetical protein [Hydrogenophaga]|uniref:hypothetical protein n=1 Tax=Hydrogenophaga TaxID=47420 RepID=UPI000555C00E|nr:MULTISPECIES: hypothetical protein [Hydrogenophaga]AOS78898.1 hypothetical protein Q5W_07975 [Hydrogenophaga sp. PBC]TMU74428.1 hypothetical protein FGJ01_12835 [Hydrogenophaga intermedia]
MVAMTMLIIGLPVLIAGILLPLPPGGWLVGLALALGLIAETIFIWASRRRPKQLLAYVFVPVVMYLCGWASISLLNWITYLEDGDIGPGGGWSIGMAGMFWAALAGFAWTLWASVIHLRSTSRRSR